MADEKKFALLIDVDNIASKYLNVMLNEAKAYGVISIRRAYGDWTENTKKTWKRNLLEHSIIPIQQFSYTTGKNASDSTMIIDAMDILYTGNVDGFILASSDSDFTRLAMRLREAGKVVIGMGESKTPAAFIQSCEGFKALDVLFTNTVSEEEEQAPPEEPPAGGEEPQTETSSITKLARIRRAMFDILDKNSDEDGRMLLSELGRLLTKRYPDFDERNYGRYRKFSEFVRNIDGLELEMVNFENGKSPVAYVRKKVMPERDASRNKKSGRRTR